MKYLKKFVRALFRIIALLAILCWILIGVALASEDFLGGIFLLLSPLLFSLIFAVIFKIQNWAFSNDESSKNES